MEWYYKKDSPPASGWSPYIISHEAEAVDELPGLREAQLQVFISGRGIPQADGEDHSMKGY